MKDIKTVGWMVIGVAVLIVLTTVFHTQISAWFAPATTPAK